MRRNLNGEIIESTLTVAKEMTDDMFAIPQLYISACSGAVSLVRIHPIFISIIFHHHKELMEIAKQIGVMREQIIACH